MCGVWKEQNFWEIETNALILRKVWSKFRKNLMFGTIFTFLCSENWSWRASPPISMGATSQQNFYNFLKNVLLHNVFIWN